MERPKRQPVVSSARAGRNSALEALKAAQQGGLGKRARTYEYKKEDEVYDVVDEGDYAAMVAKRLEEGGWLPGCRQRGARGAVPQPAAQTLPQQPNAARRSSCSRCCSATLAGGHSLSSSRAPGGRGPRSTAAL